MKKVGLGIVVGYNKNKEKQTKIRFCLEFINLTFAC